MNDFDFPPTYDLIPEKDLPEKRDYIPEHVISVQGGYCARVYRNIILGPDAELVLSLPKEFKIKTLGTFPRYSRPRLVMEMDEGELEALWSVLTVAISELDPSYCAKRLLQIEGETVARQEQS